MWFRKYSQTRTPFLTFLVSRWWRLAPVYMVCTGLSVVSALLLHPESALLEPNHFGWWLRQLLIAGSNGTGTQLPPSWSLDVEMQFYLVAPLLIILFARVGSLFRWLTTAAAAAWFVLYVFRGESVQMAHLSLFVGFFLMGITMQMEHWKPSRTMALVSLAVFFGITLFLAVFPQTRGGVWRAGLDTLTTMPDVLMSAGAAWWIIGAAMIVPFLGWNVSQVSPRFDRFLGNLAYPLYLFHWIPREWYYHFSSRSDPVWKHGALLAMNILAAAIILLLVDQPSEPLREAWVASRKREGHGGKAEEEGHRGEIYHKDTEITEFPELNTGQTDTFSENTARYEESGPRHDSGFLFCNFLQLL
jgi:peptidoglycan/LPS O-acetylase OafA/YrhL